MSDRIYGIVLAGGRSRRMGQDKALLRLCGRSLVDRTCERLAPQCHGLVISRPAEIGRGGVSTAVPFVADDGAACTGPLAGLLAGLDWIARADPGASHAVTTAVDTPFLPPDLVARLIEVRDAGNAPVVCAGSGGRRHPVVALWPVSIRDDLRSVMTDPTLRRVGAYLDRHGAVTAHWPTDPVDPFFNLNTPAEAAAAETIMRQLGLA